MMKKFKFDYDKENDDLFVYLPNKKSKGAIELGNFVLDFDGKGNLVALQIFEASKVLSKLLSKFFKLAKIKELKINVVNFRNMATIQIRIITDSTKETANIIVPRIRQKKSPALDY